MDEVEIEVDDALLETEIRSPKRASPLGIFGLIWRRATRPLVKAVARWAARRIESDCQIELSRALDRHARESAKMRLQIVKLRAKAEALEAENKAVVSMHTRMCERIKAETLAIAVTSKQLSQH